MKFATSFNEHCSYLRLIVVASSILLNLAGCSHGPMRPSELASDEIAIVATSDFHSSLIKGESLANEFSRLRSRFGDQMISLDGGDLFLGSLEGDLEHGKGVIELYNALGVDAAAIGNHDLDYGKLPDDSQADPQGYLQTRASQAHFAWLSANWIETKSKTPKYFNALGQPTVFPAHAIFQKGNLKVCVIGATTPTTNDQTLPSLLSHSRFDSLKSVIEAESRLLRNDKKCDAVILVAHAGLSCQTEPSNCLKRTSNAEVLALLEELSPGALDAVVAGHTHIRAQEIIRGVPVIQAGKKGEVVGVLHLQKRTGVPQTPDEFSRFKSQFEPFISISDEGTSPSVSSLLQPYRDQASAQQKSFIATAEEEILYSRTAESALGNLIVDSFLSWGRAHSKAQFALLPANHVRIHQIPKGPITYGQLYEMIPYKNMLVTVELTGKQLIRSLEIATASGYGLGSVSGLTIIQKPFSNPTLLGEGSIEQVLDEKGIKIHPNKLYRMIAPDYLVMGGDHQATIFSDIPAAKLRYSNQTSRDAFSDYLKEIKTVSSKRSLLPDQPRIRLTQ